MAPIDRTDPSRFIDKTVYPAIGDPSDLTADIPDSPNAGRMVSGRKWRLGHQRQLQPHLWHQPSCVSPQEMRCLICGAAFWERRAEASCRPLE